MKTLMMTLALICFGFNLNAAEVCAHVKKIETMPGYMIVTLDSFQKIVVLSGSDLENSMVVAGLTSNLKVCFGTVIESDTTYVVSNISTTP